MVADGISKQGLHAPIGFIHFIFSKDGLVREEGTLLLN